MANEMGEVLGGVVAYLCVDGALKASQFYQQAFGATEAFAHPPDETGRTMHVHLHVNGSSLMLSDGYPEHGHPFEKPQGFTLHLKIESGIDAVWKRAVDAGCEIVLPLQMMFWGDNYGQVRDPFGVLWSMGETPKT
ncbi:phnB protein [alpha proteobacterium U9-1i]|nr:phnB protein [alpha proteobacterium U9-1i]